MNKLYSSKFIDNQRSSGYKSTVYAMAEIVDNSVDAESSKIDIVFSENENFTGQRRRSLLNRIIFCDNGTGMNETILNGCLTFAEGAGKNNRRIGSFGLGLPNSSISVCSRVEVYSKQKSGKWLYVYLDLENQRNRLEPGYDKAVEKSPEFEEYTVDKDIKTIIVWSELDKLDVSKAETLVERCNRLLGRIYRYKLNDGLVINLHEASRVSKKVLKTCKVIPYDPLFLMTEENYITSKIWDAASLQDPKGRHETLSNNEIFNSKYHYSKFIEGCTRNTNKPLFQKLEDFWDVNYTSNFNGKSFNWKMRASFATSSITNPGIRAGGNTDIGRELGKKMNGDAHFPSGNIFFLRANREIDYGNFGLYTVTDEKNRFWTIEIHFDSELDELMGLSNDKQSVKFKAINNSDLDVPNELDTIPLGLQRELLWAEMTAKMKKAIQEMKKKLSEYAKQFIDLENSYTHNDKSDGNSLPQVEPTVISVIPKGQAWSNEEKKDVIKYLKGRFLHIPEKSIKIQVEQFSNGLSKTIVLYASSQTGVLYEQTEVQGKSLTLINTNHPYYTNIIEPLKRDPKLKTFAIAIELLISSCAYEMDRLVVENENLYSEPLTRYLNYLSARLSEFITDSSIMIDPSLFNNYNDIDQ